MQQGSGQPAAQQPAAAVQQPAAAVGRMTAGRVACLAAYAVSNMMLFSLLKGHYSAVCSDSWFSLFLTQNSAYCRMVSRALAILQFAPLVAVGVAIGPMAGLPLFA